MRRILFLFALVFGFQASLFSQEKKPIVILISLDGFRHDYVAKYQPENLSRFIAGGTQAKSMVPSFPSKTFPNHYTIATGMRPEHHGIVDNSFYNPEKDLVYSLGKRELVTDGSWYGGTPLWVLAEQNGMRSASYFFVGSEAAVQGVRPSEYFDYDGRVPNLTRISKAFEWLQQPDSLRPQLITMYFSDMDDIGHRFGPNNEAQISTRLKQLDHELGALFEGVKSLNQDVNIILVSDHGMAEVTLENRILLDQIVAGIDARVVNSGALAHLYLKDPKEKAKVLKELRKKTGEFKILDPRDLEYYKDLDSYGDRIGDILILANVGHYLVDDQNYLEVVARRMRMDGSDARGEHGFDPQHPDLHAIFYANGPQIKEGLTIDSFDNIHVYPLICKILGLPVPSDIDGKLEVLEPILKD
ncbi:putative AlkP superfamily pyrophosphatase or phosphodiesterase [Algoriphagus boseongensis]|uniref:Putative AlkP superfamily pyrophosphatase or phosphodiesterase n=1 Tax=Algoriphagus boseongensis TaxID=1442587 RepID=A0A4R6T4A0_9BACT|nr:ectonucleotide pyrophosphatase/phosphodiesterase [Algoriphagus boseongensis]TDQ16517.1 putative AlkP superfamily pyrophosphatase or phosphodiesterase [Algoriphagus boseongensis]